MIYLFCSNCFKNINHFENKDQYDYTEGQFRKIVSKTGYTCSLCGKSHEMYDEQIQLMEIRFDQFGTKTGDSSETHRKH